MREFIISSEQLERLIKGIEHDTGREINRVVCDGTELAEIVRCADCTYFKPGEEEPPIDWCDYFHDEVTPLGFCAWGTKTEFVTCKCGEDIERIDRIQTCPSCGRKVMA